MDLDDYQKNEAEVPVSLGKDWAMAKTMAQFARSTPQKNLTPVIIHNATRKTRLTLVIMPEWGVFFPPYNLSRLCAMSRSAGFHTTMLDVNIKAYHELKGKLDYDAWDGSREWVWAGKSYNEEIHPHLVPLFKKYLKIIIESNPDVVGFSLYYTNKQATNWMANQIRCALPNCKIIVGGPEAPNLNTDHQELYDHIIEGEGEQVLIDILEKIESSTVITEKFLKKDPKLRLDLDSMPFPDYSDYDLNEYTTPGGISAEISRGCIAKCVFCTEVHFWKYRGRMSGSLLDEVEYQNKHYGGNYFWFIDSLVNGNLKELRGFCMGIQERRIKIRWQGYARCDGRMDLDYYKDLAASGCTQLSYGIESGSQKVLDAMKKEITLDEVEKNLENGAKVGIMAHTNWIIGFPNEDHQAFADTLTLIWRIRNYNIFVISPGLSLMLSPGSDISVDKSKFNINEGNFLNLWTTNDLKNTKVHRLVRQKSFAIFLEQLNSKRYIYGFERPNLKKTYTIDYKIENLCPTIERETFDYNIINSDLGDFANSLMNEIWPLLRMLWFAVGPYKISIKFDPEVDTKEFGDRLGCQYSARHYFEINKRGNWKATHSYDFKHINHNGTKDKKFPDCSFTYDWMGGGKW